MTLGLATLVATHEIELPPLITTAEIFADTTPADDAAEWWSFDHSAASSKDHPGFWLGFAPFASQNCTRIRAWRAGD